MPIPQPNKGEHKKDFVQRCVANEKMKSEYPDIDQRLAVCSSTFDERLAAEKISFDYDETLTTDKGMELAKRFISEGADVYIISARQQKDEMLNRAKELGISESRVYATGSNKAKVEKVKDLGITKHYDNNTEVVKELGAIGVQLAESYTDYPKQATENAKIALRWAEEHGWGDCLEATGKARANQLANGEPISEQTIARMASFERHRQHSQKELGDGCGRLAWLAWGGDAGIEWGAT